MHAVTSPSTRSIVAAALLGLPLSQACRATGTDAPSEDDRPVCHIVFDAGSSGTRLHVYEAQADGTWRDNAGPEAGALADPVREQRGKTWADADAVVAEVVGLLPKLRSDFDWTSSCAVASAAVLATAGMRLAENDAPDHSAQMYAKVDAALREVLAAAGIHVDRIEIEARTLTGYEEGLYAWLALPGGPSTDLALAEMGGASTQIAFACPECSDARPIRIGGRTISVYSYSMLGLGTDEAPTTIAQGIAPNCAYGVALDDASWAPAACAGTMRIVDEQGVVDPYDYGSSGGRGTHVRLPLDRFSGEWRLTGGFTYWTDADLDTCCEQRGDCYQPESSCFRAVYLPEYRAQLGIPQTATPADTSWTLGAVICRANDCLAELDQPLPCPWRADGCAQ